MLLRCIDRVLSCKNEQGLLNRRKHDTFIVFTHHALKFIHLNINEISPQKFSFKTLH